MKFSIEIEGHQADITLPDVEGEFVGTIHSPEAGQGQIDGRRTGNAFVGTADLAGHTADFAATQNGNIITGTLSFGWFWKKHFTGTVMA